MESVYDTGKKKSAQTCNVLWSLNQMILKSGSFQVPDLCCLALALIVSRISQILSKLTLIFCSTECKTYRKSPGKIYSHQISSKSLQFHRNGTCSKKTCRIRSEGEKWNFWVPGVPAAPLGFSDETRIYFWCMSQLKTWRNIIFLCDDLS